MLSTYNKFLHCYGLSFRKPLSQDRYADDKAIPLVDEQQDYKLADFQESDGKTLLKFTRKFDSCDPRDRKLEVCV